MSSEVLLDNTAQHKYGNTRKPLTADPCPELDVIWLWWYSWFKPAFGKSQGSTSSHLALVFPQQDKARAGVQLEVALKSWLAWCSYHPALLVSVGSTMSRYLVTCPWTGNESSLGKWSQKDIPVCQCHASSSYDMTVAVEVVDSPTHSLLISQFNKLITLMLHWLHK